mgnify:CR=1 FL=1
MKQYLIETDHLTKQYGEQKSVSDLSIHVKEGRIYGLLGRNGAGKTTTMKMLLGLTKPTSGQIRIFGKNLCQENEKKNPAKNRKSHRSSGILSESYRNGKPRYFLQR